MNDGVPSGDFADDIDDMGSFDPTPSTININNNYGYDAEGRLLRDNQEEIEEIIWRVDGKVKEVRRPLASSKKNLKFDYDAMGQRIAKHIYDASDAWEKSTYYVRDAQGNVIATYGKEEKGYQVKERHIYGSSRAGMYTKEVEMISPPPLSATDFEHEQGYRQYEMSNHLGNVLAVVTDKKIPMDDGDFDSDDDGENDVTGSVGSADDVVDYYFSDLLMATDYSAFGVALDGRNFNSTSYKYGFNGQEKDDEVKGGGNSYDFGARLYDNRLGRWLTIDPLAKKYPNQSVYCGMGNNPIVLIDLDGKEIIWPKDKQQKKELKSAIKVLSKSALFKQMYKELDRSVSKVELTMYQWKEDSPRLDERALGYNQKTENGSKVGWSGKGGELILAQEMFHAYQNISENAELYKGTTTTDREVEGEVATYYFSNEINPGERKYIPMGTGIPVFKTDENGNDKVEMKFSDVFEYSPSPTSTEVQSETFDKQYQEYKGEMVNAKKGERDMGYKVPSNYTGPTTKAKAEGLIKLTNNKTK